MIRLARAAILRFYLPGANPWTDDALWDANLEALRNDMPVSQDVLIAFDIVRAILRELREPSDEMLWAAHIKLPPATTQMRNRWRAMIDHILAEGA